MCASARSTDNTPRRSPRRRQRNRASFVIRHSEFVIFVLTYPEPIEALIRAFRALPGVGPKSAERFAFHLLRGDDIARTALTRALATVRDGVATCATCGMFAEGAACQTCANPRRDRTIICVVADAADVLAIERTGEYDGVYHLLGGLLAPIEGIGPEQLRIPELVERVCGTENTERRTMNTREIIFAFDPTIEGETTVNYLARLLAPHHVRMTRIARGLPVGGDLEYADPVTLSDALSGRRELSGLPTADALNRAVRPREAAAPQPF